MPNPKGHEASLKKFKPKWRSGPTQTIRVPIALADQILDYGHRLDSGSSDELLIDRQSLETMIKHLELVLETPRNNFSSSRRGLVAMVIHQLKTILDAT